MRSIMPGINLPQLDYKNMLKMLISMLELCFIVNQLHQLLDRIRLLISYKHLLKSMRKWYVFDC